MGMGQRFRSNPKYFNADFSPTKSHGITWIQYCNPHLFFSFPLSLRSPEVRRGKETEHCADFCSFVACVAFLSLTDKKLHHQTLFTHLSLKGEFSFFSISILMASHWPQSLITVRLLCTSCYLDGN